jgi:hypothetical protein
MNERVRNVRTHPRCRLEFLLFAWALVLCGLSLAVHETPARALRIFDRTETLLVPDARNPGSTAQWTYADTSSPDSSDDDDDDDDDDGLSVELPFSITTTPGIRIISGVVASEITAPSTLIARAHSLRAPPQ